MRPGLLRAAAAGVLLASLAGCAGYRQALEECYAFSRARDYDRALASLERSSLAGSDRNRLLYLMEKGTLLHRKGEFRESSRVLQEADHLAEELYTRSLTAESLSLVSNDQLIPYAGEPYETLFVNYFLALNYLVLGELQEARVECRRLDEKLGQDEGGESGFLRLLTGLVYEALGEDNDAFIAYRRSLEAYRRAAGGEVPEVLWGRLLLAARRTGLAEEERHYREQARAAGVESEEGGTVAAVLVGRGFAPVKREAFVLVPTEHGFPVKLAVPEFQSRPCAAGPVEVSVDGDQGVAATRVEDVEALARRSLEQKKGRVLAKAVARAVAKQLAARQAEKEYGPLAGLTAQVAALLSEQADLRSWTTLPREVLLAVIPAAPGWHTVTVRAAGGEEVRAVRVGTDSVGFAAAWMP